MTPVLPLISITTHTPLDRFDINVDDPTVLSWLDRKKLARMLGIASTGTTKWEGDLKPRLERRLRTIRNHRSPSREEEARREALERLERRKRKREEEEECDRRAREKLMRRDTARNLGDDFERSQINLGSSAGVERSNGDNVSSARNASQSEGTLLPSPFSSNPSSDDEIIRQDQAQQETIAAYIKAGKGRQGRKTKKGRKLFNEMKTILQMSRSELIPLQLAEALFDFNVAQLVQYAIILEPSIQRRYLLKKRGAGPTKKEEREDLLSSILDISIEEDEEARKIVRDRDNSIEKIMGYRSVIKDYVAPLIELAWDPLLASPFSEKMVKFMDEVSRDNIVEIKGWRSILDSTWEELTLNTMAVATNFVAVRKLLSEVDLRSQFESRKTALLYQIVSRVSPMRERATREKATHGSRDIKDKRPLDEAKERAFAKLRETFGDQKFDRDFFVKWSKSKHGKANCLVGCLDPQACRRGSKCPFSHDYEKAFPKGTECIQGTCDCS